MTYQKQDKPDRQEAIQAIFDKWAKLTDAEQGLIAKTMNDPRYTDDKVFEVAYWLIANKEVRDRPTPAEIKRRLNDNHTQFNNADYDNSRHYSNDLPQAQAHSML